MISEKFAVPITELIFVGDEEIFPLKKYDIFIVGKEKS